MSPSRPRWSRRAFLAAAVPVSSAGVVLLAPGTAGTAAPASGRSTLAPNRGIPSPWYRSAYRRAVIDMHISDWDDSFLSRFDPDQYVRCLVESRAQSIVCYAQSHAGLFNYPTRIGRQHRGLAGRNIVAELIDRCHQHGIAVVLYSSLIHDRWAFDQHPDWRMKMADGREYGTGSRYGVVCPNSPYREYVRAWVEEMAEQFDVEGFRFDMTFWVGVCHCEHCQSRWRREAGGNMPSTVDWLEERWVLLQRRREAWLADFASVATDTVRSRRPRATIEHQSSTYPLNWTYGVATPLVAQNDFLQGDFYGDALQGSYLITRKSLAALRRYRVVLLPNVNVMDDDECAAIREYVREGGAVYASGSTSWIDPNGKRRPDFGLAEMFGATIRDVVWGPKEHYLSPTPAGAGLFPSNYDVEHPAFMRCALFEIRAHPGAEILATVTLPWIPREPTQFSSIHSNPPWTPTDRPEILWHTYGQGRSVYCASTIENAETLSYTFLALLNRLNDRWTVTLGGPPSVEATLFHQPERRRHVLSLINFQKELPNIPIDAIRVRIRLDSARIRRVRLLPEGRRLSHVRRNGAIEFTVPRLETLVRIALEE